MGDLEHDTTIVGGDGRYTAKLSPDWDFATPNGGYLSAIVLRAAAAETDLPRPAAYYCHYLTPPTSGETIELEVTTLRRTRRTHSSRVTVTQHGTSVLDAMTWIVTSPSDLSHDAAQMPDVPEPLAVRSAEEIHEGEDAPFPFWHNVESRPVSWTGRWDERPIMHPLYRTWLRFRPRATFDDPFVDAARALILIDTFVTPAAAMAHEGPYLAAPSMDLAVRFHHPANDAEWLLSSTESPVGIGGVLGGYGSVWTQDGRLVATGGQQMFHIGTPGG
ncbi:MAG: thioesterase family protein [Actinobacteria bacterium]|nr:thioesterase family protein [Actinomycetota bacterium]